MHPVIKTLKNGLAYAKFADKGIEDSVRNLVNELGTDLDEPNADYELDDDSAVTKAAAELEQAIDEYDEQNDTVNDVIGHSKVVEEDDVEN